MKNVFNKFNEYILISDDRGNIKLCNDKLISKLGYSEKELYNSNINKIICNQDDSMKIILNSIEDVNIKLKLYSKSNDEIDVNSKITLSQYKGEKSFFIISKEISKDLYTIEDLDTLLDNVEIGAWIKDTNGKYLYSNKKFASLAMKNKEEIMGKYDKDHWSEKNSKTYIKIDKEIIQDKRPRLLEQMIDIEGQDLCFEAYKAPILDEKGNTKYIIGITRDISLKKKIEEELYNNYNQIATLQNMINMKNNDTNIYDLLNNICKDFFKYLKADGLSIWMYDSIQKELKPSVKIDYANNTIENIKFIKIDNKEKEEEFYKCKNEGLKSIYERENIKNIKELENKGIKYLGIYNIEINDEFMGLLTILYKDDNKPKYNQDDFIKATCSQIAIIIKNYKLSEKVKIENQKRENTEKELELFLTIAADLMGILGFDGYFKKVTQKWSEVLGWSEEELLSMNIKSIIHPDDKDVIFNRSIMKEIPEEKRSFKVRYLSKDGEYVWLDWAIKYIKEHNHFIVAGKDITAEKKREEERKLLEEAIHVESVKNEFFANISHEFKTPLNIILGTMQLLDQNIQQNNITVEKLTKYVKNIKQNSYRLLRLVNNLIDMSRIDTGYYELQLTNHNIVSIIEDITLSVVNYVEGKNINLIFDTNTEEEIVACDPDKIERIMLNLLSNAIKYTDKGGEISVDLKSDINKIIVSVKDNGVGIPNGKTDIIFDRFRQANSTLTRRCEGSGIGLSLVKSLIEMHGGSIWVESEVNNGTQFIFELPISFTENKDEVIVHRDSQNYQIEKCKIEFSDIYSL